MESVVIVWYLRYIHRPYSEMPDYTLKGQLNDTFTILTVELLVSNTGMETEMTNPRPCYKWER